MSRSSLPQGRAFCGQVTTAEFKQQLSDFLAQLRATFYAQHSLKQGENGVCIAATLPAGFTLTDWEQGRVFNNEFELRWHVKNEGVELLLLTEQKDMPAACVKLCKWQPTDTDYDVVPTRHMLVGTFYRRQNDYWFFAEAGVPRPFQYPVDVNSLSNRDHAHAVLHGKHYLHGNRTVLTRFTHFSVEREHREGGERQ